jgi:FkbM family methyltransferase
MQSPTGNVELMGQYDSLQYYSDDPVFIWHVDNGQCEPYPRELAIVKSYLREYPECNRTFIDVGGHIGTQSLPYSKLFQKVVAFEPNASSYTFFKKNVEANNARNISVYNQGVYNKTAHCKVIRHSDANSGCFYIRECDANDAEAIRVVKLDDVWRTMNMHKKTQETQVVDFIKIDTEGSELYVLEGAVEIIESCKPLIQVETNHTSENYFGYSKERIYEFMWQHNYKVYNDDGNNPLFYCR